MFRDSNHDIQFRQSINKLGVLRTGILITITSMLISVGVRVMIWLFSGDDSNLVTIIFIAALVPLLIAPFMSYIFLGLIAQIEAAEQKNAKLVIELQQALAKAKTLGGLLPICATCKKIRDDAGYWHQVEVYIRDHAEVDFSNGSCPECDQEFKNQLSKLKAAKKSMPK